MELDAERIRNLLLDRIDTVEAVRDYHIETGLDSAWEPAVWVIVVIDEAREEELWPVWTPLRWEIRDLLWSLLGEDVNVCVRLWTTEDLKEHRCSAA